MRFGLAGMIGVGAVVVALNAWAQSGQPIGPSSTVQPPAAGVHPNRGLEPDKQPDGNVQTDSTGLIAISAEVNENTQRITVIDTKDRVMAVYHVDANGVIKLQNVRKIHWDLQMVQFNGESPLPQEIRARIEQLK